MKNVAETEFAQSETGTIPVNWERVKLSEGIRINPKRELEKRSMSKKVSMDSLIPFTKKIGHFELARFTGGSKFRNEDTLLARITPCLENGKTAFVDILQEVEVGHGSTEFIVLCGREGKTTNDFVYYLAMSPRLRREAIKSMTGTSGRQRVQTESFGEIEVACPPLQEQHRITKILSDLDARIELNERMNTTLESIGRAIFKRWFIDFEFPNEEGKPYRSSGGGMVYNEDLGQEIPRSWLVSPIDEIADFLNGLALQNYPPMDETDFLPVIKIRELRQGITDSSDKASRGIPKEYVVHDGDVLFSWSGSLEVVIWTSGDGALNQHLFNVTSRDYPKWFYYHWTLRHLPEYRRIAEGKATTMGHIQRHHLKNSLVLVPDKATFQRMDKVQSPIIEKLIQVGVESKNLSQIRDALLPKLMSGRIRVPVEVR